MNIFTAIGKKYFLTKMETLTFFYIRFFNFDLGRLGICRSFSFFKFTISQTKYEEEE